MTASTNSSTDAPESLDLLALCTLWRAHDAAQWQQHEDLYARTAERFLALGEPLLAFDVVNAALQQRPRDPDLQTLEALALARAGAPERAAQIMQALYDAGRRDEDTIGLLARASKDCGLAALEPATRRQHFERSRALYDEAFRVSKGYWSGINAATLSFVLGDRAEGCRLAAEVRQMCTQALLREDADAQRYWSHATLGEAALLLDDLDCAKAWYRKASGMAAATWGNLASTRRNAMLVLEHAGIEASVLQECLPRPRIVVFTGHMIDAPDRPDPRFPPAAESRVKNAIARRLDSLRAHISFSSAACGSDILFLEAMLERGGEINVVLPSAPTDFIAESVATISSGHWRERFERVLARATTVVLTSQESTGAVFLGYANLIMYGLAKARARQIDGDLSALAVWNGAAGATGGTSSAVALWRDCGQSVDVIDPLTLALQTLAPTKVGAFAQWQSSVLASNDKHRRKLVSMLFADAVGFSKLREEHIPRFVEHFLGEIARLAHRSSLAPTVRNTWGDAIYFAFEDVRAAGLLALDICDMVKRTDWTQVGLPETLGIRIGLHSGPAYPVIDPVIELFNYTGVHVSRAARIEPITPPCTVYASQEFAAIVEAVGVTEFTCEYVGRTALAKHYGDFPTYLVRRARA